MTSLVPPSDLLYGAEGVDLVFGGDTVVSRGTLAVSKAGVTLTGEDGSEYAFTFPQILLHAVCREGVERPSLFMQVEGGLQRGLEEDRDTQDEGTSPPSDVYLIPSDESSLDEIFAALCTGAELNPDVDGDGDIGDAPGMILNGGGSLGGAIEVEGGPMLDETAMMERLSAYDRLLTTGQPIVEGQFDDAENV